MDNYDEDLSHNPFFQVFLQSYPDLFSKCVCEQWLICVPRRDSLPKYAFTLEDILHHILKPLKRSTDINCDVTDNNEEKEKSSNVSNDETLNYINFNYNGITSGNFGNQWGHQSDLIDSKWNYRTLAHVNIQYVGTTLISDIETPPLLNDNNNCLEPTHPIDIPPVQYRREILFEETFYTNEKQKYKVLCIASPLNSKVAEDLSSGNCGLVPWNLTSLRDCIDFLWIKGKVKLLETFDAYIKLFLHNHRGLENFPLTVQKDLVNTLYEKCINYATTSQIENNAEEEPSEIFISDYLLQKFKLATETYVLNGIYRSLISAITSFVSYQDAQLNKTMRNLSELHPQDLEIGSIHWNNLGRAKQELGRMSSYSSPLGKLTCMKKTLRYLRSDSSSITDSKEESTLSTDELLPIWVYLIIKNPTGNWMAQLEFLRHFRFSNADQNDNENAFFIVTLEASLEHLRSGKIIGVEEAERDVGLPCDLGEIWLHTVHQNALDDPESPLGEMFDVIRLGNLLRLEELIEEYESERKAQIIEPQVRVVDQLLLCHPLCQCEKCSYLTRPVDQELLLESAVSLKSEEGLTLLHMACIYGRPKIVDYLIGLGAPLELQDAQGNTALHLSATRGHQNALLLLLHAGANIESFNMNRNLALHLAAQNGHEGCVKAIIYYAEHSRQILDVSARNCNGDTPLHYASRWGFQGIVQILVEHGAAINIPNIRHITPLDCAHDIHILRILQKSLNRRALIHSNHGDFINIEVVKKREGEEGLIMLISEPKDEVMKLEPQQEQQPTSGSDSSSRPPSRRSSVSSNSGGPAASTIVPVTRARRLSTFTTPGELGAKETKTRRSSTSVLPSSLFLTVPQSIPRSRKTSSVKTPTEGNLSIPEEIAKDVLYSNDACSPDFVYNNYLTVDPTEPEHLRRVSVESLERSHEIYKQSRFMGNDHAIAEKNKERDIRKLFSSIAIGDVPLALYYLGIPPEELDNPENDEKYLRRLPDCHPLCPCTRCVAKLGGLNLSLDIKNLEGKTPLMLAVEYNLTELVKILIRFNADINCQSTFEKHTALDIARNLDVHDIIEVLESCGASSSTSFTPIVE